MNFNEWAVPVAPQFPAKRTLRVLVVDDIALNRELLRALLQHWGHVVEEIDDGELAVERVALRLASTVRFSCFWPHAA